MIYTCTIAPSVDYTTYLPEFEAGKLNRSQEVYYYPGGKGINVSRVLKRLGADSMALGYAGGFTGDYIAHFLEDEGVLTDFIAVEEPTRINVKIKSDSETELNGPAPKISEDRLEKLMEKVKKMERGDWFVLAGTLPDSIPAAFFEEVGKVCQVNGVRLVLDTSGPALKKLIGLRPFLIKPNEDELGELFGIVISDKSDAYSYAKKLVENGVENVIVSMGGDGALLVTKEMAMSAEAPKQKVVNTVGAGDSLVSGFLASYVKEQDPLKAFKYGVASGSATAFRSDLCEKRDVEALLSQVKVNPFHEQDVTK
ncbi:1-phosphofructokinase [Planococcus sp. N028]|uniref:Tagatose-6-phosphate kinase n=1 Tax=Planococcus shixiaomingii TaxID=3058393 RepID=A0ABT8MZN7_9BACL|nr:MULTISPECIES: 1-phosphofructokinase [unclassified Planococcus (in: firmicutes)]MDN7240800.1 1-phosphofructokinase [Planococcus sp. N028]WKA53049.1 1-phosphofructokinase [Planococcus sp. N022]